MQANKIRILDIFHRVLISIIVSMKIVFFEGTYLTFIVRFDKRCKWIVYTLVRYIHVNNFIPGNKDKIIEFTFFI